MTAQDIEPPSSQPNGSTAHAAHRRLAAQTASSDHSINWLVRPRSGSPDAPGRGAADDSASGPPRRRRDAETRRAVSAAATLRPDTERGGLFPATLTA